LTPLSRGLDTRAVPATRHCAGRRGRRLCGILGQPCRAGNL